MKWLAGKTSSNSVFSLAEICSARRQRQALPDCAVRLLTLQVVLSQAYDRIGGIRMSWATVSKQCIAPVVVSFSSYWSVQRLLPCAGVSSACGAHRVLSVWWVLVEAAVCDDSGQGSGCKVRVLDLGVSCLACLVRIVRVETPSSRTATVCATGGALL